jgi:predicted RNA-binding protein YlqC (UPF0109 family)
MAEIDQQFVEYVVKSLVNHPEDVHTERKVDDQGVLVTLHVNPEDMGYVIGKQGQTAQALRILLRTVGAKADLKVHLRIYEPEGGRPSRYGNSAPTAHAAAEEDTSDPLDMSALDDIKI